MKDFDIVTLIGTKYKHQPYLQESLSRRCAGNSVMLDAGFGHGRYTNNHTGIGLLINNRTLKENTLVDKGAIAGEARGRAAYVRFKTRRGDFAFLGAYFPPKPSKKVIVPDISKHANLWQTTWLKSLAFCQMAAHNLYQWILMMGLAEPKVGGNMYTMAQMLSKNMPADWKNSKMVREPCSG